MGSRATLSIVLFCALGASGLFLWMTNWEANPRSGQPEISLPVLPTGEEVRVPAELDEVEVPKQDTGRALVAERSDETRNPAAVQGRKNHTQESRVRGRVVDEAGNPVVEARVVGGGSNNTIVDFDSDTPFFTPQRAEGLTDARGVFELDVPHSGSMSFTVRADGFAPFRQGDVPVSSGKTTQLDDFELETGVILSGVVVDPNGKGVGGAEIVQLDHRHGLSFGIGTRKAMATTEYDGSFRVSQLAAGAYRLLVRTEDHPDLTVEGVADKPGREYGGLVWTLGFGAQIAGNVLDIPADEVGELQVRATRSGEGLSIMERGRRGEVEANGRFTIRGLTPDKYYDISLMRTGVRGFEFFGRSRSEIVKARAGDSGIALHYQPEGSLTFQLMDKEKGTPIEAFSVSAGTNWAGPLRDENGGVKREHPGGMVRFGGLRPASSDDRIQLKITAAGYEEYERDDIALRIGQELDLGQVFIAPVPLVRVTVLTADGIPIEGANVRLQRDTGGQMQISRRIEISEDSHFEHTEVGDGRSARTNEDGIAELTSYPGEPCKITSRASGFAPETNEVQLPRDSLYEHVLRMRRGGTVLVKVLDASGQPLPGAKVGHREPSVGRRGGPGSSGGFAGMMGGGGSLHPTVADSEGFARFENLQEGLHAFSLQEDNNDGVFFGGGEMVMVAGMGGGGDADWRDIQVIEEQVAELTLTATPRGSLEGTVLEAGDEFAGARLKLKEFKENEESDPMALAMASFGGGGGKTEKSDGKGDFAFSDVKVGRYLLEVSHPMRRMPVEYEVEILRGRNSIDIDLPISIIEGRITDIEGKPLAGLTVKAQRPRDSGRGPGPGRIMMFATDNGDETVISDGSAVLGDSVKTDADGRYTLRGVTPDIELVVKAEGSAVQPGTSRKIRVAANETKDGIDFKLDAGGSIDIEVQASDGSPVRMAIVSANHLEDDEVDPKSEVIQRGTGKMTGLKPGRWNVSVRKIGPMGGGDPVEQEVLVRPGKTAEALLRFN